MRQAFSALLVVTLCAAPAFAAGAKKKTKSSGTLPTTNTSTISASEGSTAGAIRGIVEPDGATNAAVLAVDAVKGIVTVRMRKTGSTFKLLVSASQAADLDIGDNVTANFDAKTAQVAGISAQLRFTSADACCAIAAINQSDGMVTVKEPAVGRTFQIKVGVEPTNGIRVGQAVEVDFKARTARLSGLATSFSITNLSQPAP